MWGSAKEWREESWKKWDKGDEKSEWVMFSRYLFDYILKACRRKDRKADDKYIRSWVTQGT